jgi:hypothetical protein
MPPAAISFSTNGSAAASSTAATFTNAGTDTFQVAITDTSWLSTTSNVFDQSGGTGSTVTVSAVGVAFNNGTVAQGNPTGSNASRLTIGGSTAAITVNGTFTYAGGTDTFITAGTIWLALAYL